MGKTLDEDTSYVYQENATKSTLRELRKKFQMIAHASNSKEHLLANTEEIKSFDDTSLALNIAVPTLSAEPNCRLDDVKYNLSSTCSFNPRLASTPIKSNLLGNALQSKPLYSVKEENQEINLKWIGMDPNHSPHSNSDQELNTIKELIIQQTLANVPTFGEVTSPFMPVAMIDNIPVSKVVTETVFEVPNTMIAYLFDENTQDVHPMRIIPMDEDIYTYDLNTKNAAEDMKNTLTAQQCEKECLDQNSRENSLEKKYRKTALKWKNIRHMVPRRPIKPEINGCTSKIISTHKNKIKCKQDADYKPPSTIQVNKGKTKYYK